MIDLGGVYPAALNLFDADNQPVNADTVTLTITLPDGTTPALIVGNPPAVTGQYSYDFISSMPGRHMVRWQTTVPYVSWTDVFDVAEANPPAILSLSETKQLLMIDADDTTDDDAIRFMLMSNTRAVEMYKNEAITQRTVVENVAYGGTWGSGWPVRGKARLTTCPVIAIQSVTSLDGTITWDPANLLLHKESGLVEVISGPPLAGRMVFTYTAGYQIIPYHILEGAKTLFMHIWESRRGPGGVGGVVGPEELADYKHSTGLPRKVMEQLGPPRPTVF